MSSIKFSQLQSLTSPPSDTVFPIVSSGSNYKITLSSIKTAVIPSWSEVTGKPNFNSVAFSGLYADLSGKPTIPVIPTLVSAFTNDRGYLTSVDYTTITNAPQLSAVATSGNWLDIINKPAWFSTTATGYLYSNGSGVLSFQPVIDVSGGISVATVNTLIANSLSNFISGTTTATVTALIANSLSNFVSGVSTATVTSLIANSLTNYATQSYVVTQGYTTTATVNTLIANSLTNNLATVARTGNWTDVVNKPAWVSTTATGYLYSDGNGVLFFQPVQGGVPSDRLVNGINEVVLGSNGTVTFPNGALKIAGNIISNYVTTEFGASGSQLEVALAKTVITSGVTNSLGGGPFLTSQYLFEVNPNKILSSFQVINGLGEGEPTLTSELITELDNSGFKIGQIVTNDLGGDSEPLVGFSGWTFGTVSQQQAITFPDSTVQTTAYTSATVKTLIANSLSNFISGVSTSTVNTLIANSLTNNLATVARTGNWTDVVNKPAWFSTTATGYLYSDGSGTLGFQSVQGGSTGWQLTSSTAVVSLAADGKLTLPNSGTIDDTNNPGTPGIFISRTFQTPVAPAEQPDYWFGTDRITLLLSDADGTQIASYLALGIGVRVWFTVGDSYLITGVEQVQAEFGGNPYGVWNVHATGMGNRFATIQANALIFIYTGATPNTYTNFPQYVPPSGYITLSKGVHDWTFGTDGVLTLPAGGDIVDSTGTTVLGGGSGDRLTNGINTFVLGPDGTLQYPHNVVQQDTDTVTCAGNTSTVVYTSLSNQQHTIKLLIQVEGYEAPETINWDTQACEMIVVKKFNGPTVASTVYGIVHTSVDPLATFTAEWNTLTNRVEVLCATPSANEVYVRTFATEIYTAD